MTYEQVYAWDNLWLAWRQAAKGKRSRPAAARFEYHLEDNLVALQEELAEKRYQPGQYASFHIHEPKRRLISAAPFRDRVVHHALCNVMEPAFERSFIADSFANRIGKGTHRALDRCQEFARRYRYVLQGDVRQFFPSIDLTILQATLRRKVRDQDIQWLISQIVTSGVGVLSDEYEMVYFPGDDLLAATRARGLPIGNLTSQFWANCYLSSFDHFIQRELRCPAYLRYVDDFVLFGDDVTQLWGWKAAVIERLAGLRLTIHEENAQIHPVTEGIPFLGFTVFPQRRRLKRRKGIAFCRRLRTLAECYADGEITLDQMSASVRSWTNHVRYGNTVGLRESVLASVPLRPPRRRSTTPRLTDEVARYGSNTAVHQDL